MSVLDKHWNRRNLLVPRRICRGLGKFGVIRIAKGVGDSVVPQAKRGCHNNRPRAI